MYIELACGCGSKMRVSAEHIGKRARCPKCGSLVEVVPQADSPAGSFSAASSSPASAPPVRPLVTATAVRQPPSTTTFDPLDLGDLNFSASPVATDQTLASSNWSAGGSYAPPRRQAAGMRRGMWIALAIGAVCTLAFIGVGAVVFVIAKTSRNGAVASQPGSGSNRTGSASAAPAKQVVPLGPPLTEVEAEALVDRYVAAIHGRDFNLCKHLFPTEKIYEAIADDAKLSGRERREFLTAAGRQPQFWEQLHDYTRTGAEYVVLRPIQRSGEVRVIVRLSSEQSGLNYHEYILRRNERQEAEIADVYIMAAGATLSESISQLVIAMLATRNSTLLGRFGGGNKLVAESGDRLKKIKTLMNTAPELALQEFDKLPVQLQREKSVMVMKLVVCGAAGPEKYAACFEEFQRQFPGDACIDLLAIDYHINRNDMASAAASAQRLNTFVGGDPLLENLISGLDTQ